MSGLGDGALDIELEDRLCGRCPLLRQPQLRWLANPIWCAFVTAPDRIDGRGIVVGRPVLAEVVEKIGPRCELIPLEMPNREREAMVDPSDEAPAGSSLFYKPYGDFFPRPVPGPWSGRCNPFGKPAIGGVDLEAGEP